MPKARILLSGRTNLQYYIQALNELGAVADAKYLPKINLDYDGLILCGGNDIHPKYYNEQMSGSVNIDNDRDTAEFALLKAYVDAGKPVLGICRGYQLINAFFGGSLYQHLPESERHTNKTDYYCTHAVTAETDSIIGKLYGASFPVNSSHHQAVKELGAGLRATVFWMDKYIEAYEHTALPIIGVQWHPERMCFEQKRPDTVDGAKLIRYFIEMCEKQK